MLPDTVGTTSGRTMFAAYLAKEGATVAGSGVVSDTYNANATITIDGVLASSGNTYNDGAWHTVNITFTATAEMVANGVYVGASYGGAHNGKDCLYLDDFALVDTADIVADEPGEGNSDPEADVNYDTSSKFQVYTANTFHNEGDTANATIDGAALNLGKNWGSAVISTIDGMTIPNEVGDNFAMDINSFGTFVATKLENLVAGKKYNFSFKYAMAAATAAYNNYQLFEVYLAKHNATALNNKTDVIADADNYNSVATITIDGVATNVDNAARTANDTVWKTVSITFTATSDMATNGVYAGFAVGNWTNGAIYAADFDLSVVRPVAAEDVDYNTASKWKLYADNWIHKPAIDGVNGEAAGSGWFPIADASTPGLPTGSLGLKFGGTGMHAATKLENLVAGTEYIFTFEMMVPSVNTGAGRPMFGAYLSKPGATVDGNGNIAAANTYNSVATITVEGEAVNTSTSAYKDDTWRTVTIRFTATEEMVTNGVFAGVSYGGEHNSAANSMVLDDFDLVVVPKYEEFDNNTVGTKNYNSASDWYEYGNATALGIKTAPLGATVAGEGETLAKQGGMEYNYAQLSAEDTNGKSLTASGLLRTYANKLEGLEANKTYTFTFKYKIAHFNVINKNSGSLLKAAIYKTGAAISQYNGFDDAYRVGNVYTHTTNVLSAEQSVWKEVKLTFTPSAEDIAAGLYIAITQTYEGADVDIDDTAAENIVSNTSSAATAAGGKYGAYYYDELRLAKALPETFVENKAAICNKMNLTGGLVKEVNGLRIYNRFYNVWHDADIIEYGSIAIRSGRINNANELTLDAANATKGISYLALGEDSVNIVWTKDDASTTYTSYLSGIAPKYYGADYTIRSYAKDVNGNVYYGEAFSLCIYDVVHAIKTANANAADVAIAEEFIAAAEQAGVQTYAQWVKANKLDKVAGQGYVG
jgi:hypothetical protein